MIATLAGKVDEVRITSLVIENNGIGYEVFTVARDIAEAKAEQPVRFYIHEHIREELHDLYGFSALENKLMFELLLSVNGVGPKVALAIVSGVENLGDAIRTGNTASLQSVSGVGKRVAERIIVDLSHKLGSGIEGLSRNEANSSVYEALTQLGFSPSQVHETIAKLPSDISGDEARIKWALRELGK